MRVNKKVFEMTRQIRKYTNEFKQESVNLALKSPSIAKTATELGIPIATLHTWIKQLKEKAPANASKVDKNNDPDIAALLAENRRLQKENVVLKEEKEILKKAAACVPQVHQ
jgi:transposase